MSKYAQDLAKQYELGNNQEDFFNYIVDSLINGQRQQVRNLFNEMHKDDQQDFLINHLDVNVPIDKSVLNICIIELTK